jgi:hypothetical protein
VHVFAGWGHWLWEHRPDIIIGAVFALFFGFIIDLLAIGSRTREAFRELKNKLAQRSVARLRRRIGELENYQQKIDTYSKSDRFLYLATFRYILSILFLFAMAGAMGSLPITNGGFWFTTWPARVASYVAAIVMAIEGLKLSALDTVDKLNRLYLKVEGEKSELKMKLQKKLGP